MESKDATFYPKTHAKELYCLAEKDLQPLPVKEKLNPYNRSGASMKLYKQSDLEQVATKRWGSPDKMEQEKRRRVAKRERKALEQSIPACEDEQLEIEGTGTTAGSSSSKHSPFDTTGKLHPLVAERVQKLKEGTLDGSPRGGYVLYWMRTAIRDHDNPALDVAAAEAKARRLPLLCISTLLGKGTHTYPTHRRFKFLLEGIKDVQESFKAKGLPFLLYVEGVSQHLSPRVTTGWEAVLAAARGASLVVTEIMPTPPYAQNLQDLAAADLPAAVGVWAVDTACIVPVTLTKKPYAKAYAYRSGTVNNRNERLRLLPYSGVPGLDLDALAFPSLVASIPWTSVDLGIVPDLAALLRESQAFDASVPGVDHMTGSQSAGYARWEAFRRSGLSQYAARRNNPMLRSGVSRMSAYHHFGMVSPFRIAREAASTNNSGARKFADEFMTWREISHCFCFHSWHILESLQALPVWAQKTLSEHSRDPRDLKSLEQMEQGNTGDKIWDALQFQLNSTGELHNNVRMTWGKALLNWTTDPETALKQTCHLNHKYALDGCDPSSYGGILWCFGQFDGPKGSNSTPIFGSLRSRPTHWLTRKLDPVRFRELPLESTTEQLISAAASAEDDLEGNHGLRAPTCGQKTAESGGENTGLDRGSGSGGLSTGAPNVSSKKPTATNRAAKTKDKDQPSIEKYFKRRKCHGA